MSDVKYCPGRIGVWKMSSNPERRLIGCILLSVKEIVPTLRGCLKSSDFMDENYRKIWNAACELCDSGWWPEDYRVTVAHLAADNNDIADLARAIYHESATSQTWRYWAWQVVLKSEATRLGVNNNAGDNLPEQLQKRISELKGSQRRLILAKKVLQQDSD